MQQTANIDDALTLDLERLLTAAKAAVLLEPVPDAALRKDRLTRLEAMLIDHQERFCDAVDSDFGGRPRIQTRMEIFGALEAIRHARKNVARWMLPERRPVPLIQWLVGMSAQVHYQPLGVVGVVAPWNFPLVLSLGALASVFAAGNRAMLKPSELSPATSALLKELLDEAFSPEELSTILGGPEIGAAFTSLAFDHLLFTGSPSVGKRVMAAAAANLVPVTLELGGKCPVIIGHDADFDLAVNRTIWGKIQNAGQICLAPDYVLVPEGQVEQFVAKAKEVFATWYPAVAGNPDFCAIIDDRHYCRLTGYLAEARAAGVEVIPLDGKSIRPEPNGDRRLPPTLVISPPAHLAIMKDEIFGPLLPILTYRTLDEAIGIVNAAARPLALYYFGKDNRDIEALVHRTTSGGITINDIASHAANESLPLGGVGNSGMGAYHGQDGFRAFSHAKAVMVQRGISLSRFMNPPYTSRKHSTIKYLIGRSPKRRGAVDKLTRPQSD